MDYNGVWSAMHGLQWSMECTDYKVWSMKYGIKV
jgi:hypothetical protein